MSTVGKSTRTGISAGFRSYKMFLEVAIFRNCKLLSISPISGPDMNDNPSIDEIFAEREDWARRSMKETTAAEALTLVHTMFADNVTHPWYEGCQTFLAGNSGVRLVRGELPGGVAFLYAPAANSGMWFRFTGSLEAIGKIGNRGLEILSRLTKTNP